MDTAQKGPPTHQAKARKKNRRKPKQITVAIYNALREAWFERQDLTYAARRAGVSRSMATRYITGRGNVAKGFVPINERWLQAQAEAQDRQDLTYIEFQSKVLGLIKGGLEEVKGELYMIQRYVMGRIQDYQRDLAAWEALPPAKRALEPKPMPLPVSTMKDLSSAIQRLTQVGEKVLTGEDLRIGVGIGVDESLRGITDAQLLRMVETGLFPDELDRPRLPRTGDGTPN